MELTAHREHLLQAVLLAERLAGKKESLPVLSCILLEASGKTLSARSTNLEAGVEAWVPSSIKDGGVIAVPATILRETIRALQGDTITLRDIDGNLTIESRGSKNLIKAIAHDEFPTLSSGKEKKGFSISRDILLHSITSVSYAASPSMIRPDLGSVYVSIDQGTLTTAATDSFRLAEKKVPGATKKDRAEILLPLKHAQELAFILERSGAHEVEIEIEENQLSVSSDAVRFISRVVDGIFPNYEEIVPKTTTTGASLLKGDFIELLRKARIFAGSDQYVGLHIYPSRKIFSATARSGEVGEMSDTIDAALTGDDVDINFHIGYLSDCLPVINSDSITLSFSGAGKPLIIRGISDASFMYLVMPLNR